MEIKLKKPFKSEFLMEDLITSCWICFLWRLF